MMKQCLCDWGFPFDCYTIAWSVINLVGRLYTLVVVCAGDERVGNKKSRSSDWYASAEPTPEAPD